MKVVKILLKTVVVLVALLVVALLTMPLWFGPVVKTAANSAVPGIVKTDFHLGHISLNPYTGRFELGDMQLSNPEGYPEKYAATLGDIAFDVAMTTLTSDVIHIEEIKVNGVFVSVVSKNGVGNFEQIQYNVAGGKEKYEAAQAEKKAKAEAEANQAKPEEKAEKADESKPAKKFVIDRLEISGIKLQLGFMPITIPVDIKLADIGKKSDGATLEEVWNSIVEAVLKSAGVVGDQLKALGGVAGDAAKQATAAAGKIAGQATEAVGSAASAATEAVGGAAGKAADVVGGAAGAATDAVGSGVKAVGEGASKAVDALKSLW